MSGFEIVGEETEWFHLFANPRGMHGRLIATAESLVVAKRVMIDFYGIPANAWRPAHSSEAGSQVNIWVSFHKNEAVRSFEEPDTSFSIERVFVVRAASFGAGISAAL
ncbi:MAG: hypothetical protein F6J97_23300 [Leptolyngbya sp. SIO4C1]|nr:hypothetical protein [Leptolyngbya sp. SIO4C1]